MPQLKGGHNTSHLRRKDKTSHFSEMSELGGCIEISEFLNIIGFANLKILSIN